MEIDQQGTAQAEMNITDILTSQNVTMISQNSLRLLI